MDRGLGVVPGLLTEPVAAVAPPLCPLPRPLVVAVYVSVAAAAALTLFSRGDVTA